MKKKNTWLQRLWKGGDRSPETVTMVGTVSAELVPGQLVGGRYRIIEQIGRGGMGIVYRADHEALRRPVAIKRLLTEFAIEADTSAEARFEREARAACRVNHPNAITIHDFGLEQGSPYMVMEFLEGEKLSDVLLASGPLIPERAYALLAPIASALARAHSVGIVHRDLKPDNVMVQQDGAGSEWVKVLDFGIAGLLEDWGQEQALGGLTAKGMIMGSPPYMSPEQIRGEVVDARSDLYSLGVMLYEMLAGTRPFRGPSFANFIYQHTQQEPEPFSAGSSGVVVSEAVATVVLRALAKQPADRYRSVLEFMGDLRGAVFGSPRPLSLERTDDANQSAPTYSVDELLASLRQAQEQSRRGDNLSAYETLAPCIENGVRDPQILHLAILSLARCGARQLARSQLTRYREFLPDGEDYQMLDARLQKDSFLRVAGTAQGRQQGEDATSAYRAIYEKTGGYYPAINAATVAFLNDDTSGAQKLAEAALGATAGAEPGYWLHATRAEACVILGRYDDANRHLRAACSAPDADTASRGVTSRQLLRLCEKRRVTLAGLAFLRPPTSAHYTGHMLHGLGNSPGIDPMDEDLLRSGIRIFLQEENVGASYGSLACGADILVAEETLGQGAELHVVLPFDSAIFRRLCVAPAGRDWEARFDTALQRATSVTLVATDPCGDEDLLYGLTTRHAIGLARLRAQNLGTDIVQLALSNRQAALGRAGTASDRAAFEAFGGRSCVIEVPLPRPGTPALTPAAALQTGIWTEKRELVAAVFADVAGFSKIEESRLPEFIAEWHQRLQEMQERQGHAIAYANTWGDGLIVVTRSIASAAEVAAFLAHPLPGGAGVRVSVHAGLAFPRFDPLQQRPVYYGTSINLAARVEACAPQNAVFATEAFATLLATEKGADWRCEYAGILELPKAAGRHRMYALEGPGSHR